MQTPMDDSKKNALDQTRAEALAASDALKPKLAESRDFSGDRAVIIKPSVERIHTLVQLLAFCEVDPEEWEVERWVCNKWEVGGFPRATREGDEERWTRPHSKGDLKVHPLYQIKAWLRKKVHVIAAKAEIEILRQKAEAFAPQYPPNIGHAVHVAGNLAEFSIFDHHFGALVWGKETGGADYDLKIARKSWESALSMLIERTRHFKLDEALIVLGNDQQNADNRQGTTERGTPQSMDGRHQKVFGVSRDCSIWAIEQLRGIARKVSVVIVPGNHDPLACWYLGDSLAAWFRRCPSVAVDNGPTFRKYRQHGNVMLMWSHGNTGKLEKYGETMAAEQARMWGETSWREAHTGDKHQRRLIELKGATVRILPSLRPPCAWSSENHFLGSIRAAEAYVWNKEEGLISTATYSITPSNRDVRVA